MHKKIVLLSLLLICSTAFTQAHDDGKFAGSPLKTWFDGLASSKGLCCSFADGMSIEDVDWDTTTNETKIASPNLTPIVHYRVRLNGQWVVVPDTAVVTVPNRYGPAVVWPYQDADGVTQIRCFLPGAGS